MITKDVSVLLNLDGPYPADVDRQPDERLKYLSSKLGCTICRPVQCDEVKRLLKNMASLDLELTLTVRAFTRISALHLKTRDRCIKKR